MFSCHELSQSVRYGWYIVTGMLEREMEKIFRQSLVLILLMMLVRKTDFILQKALSEGA